MSKLIGKYLVVREGWSCNICGHMTYNGCITHKCGKAPHVLNHEVIGVVKKGNVKKVKALLKEAQDAD